MIADQAAATVISRDEVFEAADLHGVYLVDLVYLVSLVGLVNLVYLVNFVDFVYMGFMALSD